MSLSSKISTSAQKINILSILIESVLHLDCRVETENTQMELER